MIDQKATQVVPSNRQLMFQQTEFYAFIHFTVNTFTNKEWGNGLESPEIFNPTKFDAAQIVNAVKAGGMKGLIITAKHHDGFCLWPCEHTDHTVANSPYKNGNGDIIRELSEECERQKIKFGVYLSPWDQNNSSYGSGEEYDNFFINQLTELLTNYGPIFCVWFDGACGEGPNGKKQVYNWDRYYDVIRQLQPDACINVCGPDIRWCGNEAGDTRESEWSVVPAVMVTNETVQEQSQKEDDEKFRKQKISSNLKDLGSRSVLNKYDNYVWYPAEVNVSIRPGWFYHEDEDDKVKSIDTLKSIYYNSVGGNATFLLNLAPNTKGLIPSEDVQVLNEFGTFLKTEFKNNLICNATLQASNCAADSSIEHVREDNYRSYFAATNSNCTVDIKFNDMTHIKHIVLKENIEKSQRIEKFKVIMKINESEIEIYNSTVVGYKKIIPELNVVTDNITIEIIDSRIYPTLSFIGIY